MRIARGWSQRELGERLGISPSYLNLIERERRPITTELLLRAARVLDLDLRSLGADDAQLSAAMTEIATDPLFEDFAVTAAEIQDLVTTHPNFARMFRQLHTHYAESRSQLETLGAQLLAEDAESRVDRTRLSSEEVSDFFERHGNYFPALEEAAERLWADAQLDGDGMFGLLKQHVQRTCGVRVSVCRSDDMNGAVRRYHRDRRELLLSDALRPQSRTFQLALQIALLSCPETLDRLVQDPALRSEGSRGLCRVALASYFAAAVMMPYSEFLQSAEASRYDIEVLGRRFGVGWEQTCHRLTTLRRPGKEGVAFYLLRVDMAGNISKRFSAAGIRFPRFSGLCALWNVHGAFAQPGRVRVQLSRLPDSRTVLAIARTVRRDIGTYRASEVLYSVGIGCDVSDARRVVYADAVNVDSLEGAVPIGITCRTCERLNCTARAFPSIGKPLRIDENVRGVSFFAPVAGST